MTTTNPSSAPQNFTLDGDGNGDKYQLFLSILHNDVPITLTPNQMVILQKPMAVDRNRFVINGPPGTGKTFILTWLVLGLQLAGHKVLLTAPKNNIVDSTAIVYESTTKLFIEAVKTKIAKEKDGPGKTKLEEILKKAEALNTLRWLSEYEDGKLIKCPRAVVRDRVLLGPRRELEVLSNATLNNLRDTAIREDSLAQASRAHGDLATFHRHIQARDTAENEHKTRLQQIFMLGTQETYNYPVAYSTLHYVEEANRSLITNPDSQRTMDLVVKSWRRWDHALTTALTSTTEDVDVEHMLMLRTRNDVFKALIMQADLVFCNCIRSADRPLLENFKPTVAIISDAQYISEADGARTVWRYESLQLGIITGYLP